VLSIEEYIARRKREDGINEFDMESRMENLQTVWAMFLSILISIWILQRLKSRRLSIMRGSKSIESNYVNMNQRFRNGWLIFMQSTINKSIIPSVISLKKDELFLLYNTNHEFRSAS
jgi:hypothetical protein